MAAAGRRRENGLPGWRAHTRCSLQARWRSPVSSRSRGPDDSPRAPERLCRASISPPGVFADDNDLLGMSVPPTAAWPGAAGAREDGALAAGTDEQRVPRREQMTTLSQRHDRATVRGKPTTRGEAEAPAEPIDLRNYCRLGRAGTALRRRRRLAAQPFAKRERDATSYRPRRRPQPSLLQRQSGRGHLGRRVRHARRSSAPAASFTVLGTDALDLDPDAPPHAGPEGSRC